MSKSSQMAQEEVRVILVDDDATLREDVKSLLVLNGYTVWDAGGAEPALELIEAHRPHCVIFDLTMPGMGGVELARHVRAGFGSELVMIALTGSSQPPDITDAEQAGADFVLRKPLDVKRLRQLLPRVA